MKRALCLCLLLACQPDFAERESLVTTRRVLAVRSEPAEARPGESVTYDVLVAAPDGAPPPPAAYAFCASPKRLTENGAVSAACLSDAGVRPMASPTAAIPTDACFLFGPEVASADLRPRDPDATGGFYQPVRVLVAGAEAPAFGATRVRCQLGNAGAEAAAELARSYVANRNPTLLPLVASAPLDGVPAGARVALRASWAEADAEAYVALDVASQQVLPRREALRVSWFATAGAFDEDRTGRAEEEREVFTENAWTAPSSPGTVFLHLVLRDNRGGVAFTSAVVTVR